MVATLEVNGPAMEELWGWLDGTRKPPLEALIEGPAGTGKTRAILEFIRSYVEQNEGVRVLIMRDRRVDMTGTVLVEWEDEVLGPDHPAVMGGPSRAHRERYVFENGSEVVLGGFNNETKLFSGQYHGIYFNECQETIERKWETLHRALRAKGGPFRFFLGDCNPEHAGHWMNKRCEQGVTMRLVTRLWNNPRFFRDGVWQEDGIEYATRLKTGLSGANFERLYLGKWANAHGLIWPEYDETVHLVYGKLEQNKVGVWSVKLDTGKVEELRWFVLSMDLGITSPGCLQAWGVTPEGVMYRVEEYYRTGWDHSEWIARAVPMAKKYRAQAMVSDHDGAFIKAMNRALQDAQYSPIVQTADKTLGKPGREGKKTRIEMMRTRWKQRRAFLLRDAVRERDPRLVSQNGRPTCFEEEIPAWCHAEYVRGEDASDRADDPDPTADDHGCDAAMYACAYVWGRQPEAVVVQPELPVGSVGRALGWKLPDQPSIWEKRT